MYIGFHDSPDACDWLRNGPLKGVILPAAYQNFQSFILQGTTYDPYAVNLYVSKDPLFKDDFYRVRFVNDPPIYCICKEYDGELNLPKGGLGPIV